MKTYTEKEYRKALHTIMVLTHLSPTSEELKNDPDGRRAKEHDEFRHRMNRLAGGFFGGEHNLFN